jgi:hypothetical protein
VVDALVALEVDDAADAVTGDVDLADGDDVGRRALDDLGLEVGGARPAGAAREARIRAAGTRRRMGGRNSSGGGKLRGAGE